MKKLYIIIFALILITQSSFAENLIGHYSAVTESEAVIELELKENGKAVLITGWLPEEPDVAFEPYLRNGSWVIDRDFLEIEIKGLKKLRYKIMDILSYDEFGGDGGSFGFYPEKTNEEPFNRFRLWRKSDLNKYFEK